MKDYPTPDDVTSPRLNWRIIRVLFRGVESDPAAHDPEAYSVALGMWDDSPCLAMRWNCNPDRPVGHPHSRGLPTWFIIPPAMRDTVLETLARFLPSDTIDYARNVLK